MSDRTGSTVAVWVVSIALAILFLISGVPKLWGGGVFPMFGMHEFPAWIRVVVGVVEIVFGLGLLVRGVSAFSGIMLAFLMIPAFVTQLISGGAGGAVVTGVVFIALLFVAWGREPDTVQRSYRNVTSGPHPMLREGVIAGLIGATCIAVLFFVIDISTGHLLFTPSVLGRGLVSIIAPNVSAEHTTGFVITYTIFHYLAFIVVGILASFVVQLAHREPSVLMGFVVLFAWIEVGFYSMVALLSQSQLGSFAWYNVMIGNLIAALAMGFYLWRAHPALSYDFRHSMDAEDARTTGAAAISRER